MNNKKTTIAMICAVWAVALPVMSFAASGVIELEIPGMNPVTAVTITDFTTNPCPATVDAIRTSVASNYDGVVVRKAEKRDELQAEAKRPPSGGTRRHTPLANTRFTAK